MFSFPRFVRRPRKMGCGRDLRAWLDSPFAFRSIGKRSHCVPVGYHPAGTSLLVLWQLAPAQRQEWHSR
jgi:hypothetical protein